MPSQPHSQHWDSPRGKETIFLVLSYGSSPPTPCHSCHPKGTPAPAALWVSLLSVFSDSSAGRGRNQSSPPVLWGGLGMRQQHSSQEW